MKTVKLILIFFIISRIFIVSGQNTAPKKVNPKPSKVDTENWIISKYNEFKSASSTYTYISFSDDDLICKVSMTSDSGEKSYLYFIVHIKDIEYIKYTYYESSDQYSIDFIASDNIRLLETSDSYPAIKIYTTKNHFSLFFSKLIEDNNMKNRIFQAFERLLEIHGVKITKVKEVF